MLPDVAYSIKGRHVLCKAGESGPERRTTAVRVSKKWMIEEMQ